MFDTFVLSIDELMVLLNKYVTSPNGLLLYAHYFLFLIVISNYAALYEYNIDMFRKNQKNKKRSKYQ